MKTKYLICLLSIILSTSSCQDRAQNDVFLIPSDQLPSVIKKAEADDLDSIRILIMHYESSRGGDSLAEKWRAKARYLGDSQELYYYAANIYTAARKEPNLAKRRRMFSDAMSYAKLSYRSNANSSTKSLIDEISESLKEAR